MSGSDKQYWISSGFYALVQRGSEFLFGFGGFYLLVRVLSKEDFGAWVLYITLVSIFEMSRAGFLQNGLIKYLVKAEGEAYRNYLNASWWLNGGITLLSAILVLVLAQPLAALWRLPDFVSLCTILAIGLLPFVVFTQTQIVLQARMDFKAIFRISLLRQGLFFALIVGLYLADQQVGVAQLAWMQTGVLSLATAYAFYEARSHWRPFGKPSAQESKDLFHFGKFVLGTNLASMLNNSLDKFVLGALLSPAQVASNNVATRLLNFIEVPINSIATVVFPKSAEKAASEGVAALKNIFEQSVGAMLSITLPFFTGLMLLAEPVVLVVAGSEYQDAVPFLRAVLLLALLKPYDRQTGIFLDAIGKPQINLYTVLFSLAVTFGMSWWFIQSMGFMGAAWALVVSVALTVVLKQWVLHRYLQTQPLNAFAYAVKFYPQLWEVVRRKLFRKG